MVMTVRLFVKRDTSELYSRYEVFDQCGELKYTVRGKHTPSGEFVRIRDRKDAAVCKIRRLGINSLSAYIIRSDSENIRMNIVLAGAVATVRFRGISFCIRGDVIAGNYDILDADNSVVCAVCRDFTKGALTLTVNVEERELICIAAAVCIDSLSPDTTPVYQPI